MRTRKWVTQSFASLLVLALLGAIVSKASAAAENGNILDRIFTKNNTDSFSGTWDTMKVNGDRFTWKLRQTGNNVTGTYSPGSDKIEEGKISDAKLSFKWRRTGAGGTYRGNGRFKLSDDGQSLTGSFNNKEGPTTGEENYTATRTPASFQGSWTWKQIDTGNDVVHKTMHFTQVGDKVDTMEFMGGIVVGRTLFFNWDATGLNHNAVLILSDDGKSFYGMFNHDGDNRRGNAPTHGQYVGAEVTAGK